MAKGQEVVVKQESGLANEDWYQALLTDCQAIGVERGYNARMEIIAAKYELGGRVHEERGRERKYGERIIESLAVDLKMSKSDLFSCVQFYKQYPVEKYATLEDVLDTFKEGKSVSWFTIRQNYLGTKEKKEAKAKQSYKLTDVNEVLKVFLYEEMEVRDDKKIEKLLSEFTERLISYKDEE